MASQAYKIALVAGEASSDMIGANLIKDLMQINDSIQIIAVGGQQIKATSAIMIEDNEVFSVMGLVEVLQDLPHILKKKKQIVANILSFEPDLFIGVDSPDLNFSIAKIMRKHDIPVCHYVSPSVWAWRPKRVHKMANFINSLLTLFPFEVDLYRQTAIQAKFVGHPLASSIPVDIDKQAAKQRINCANKKILAVLPGSRNREIRSLMPVFAAAIKQMGLTKEWQVMSSNVSQEKVKSVQAIAKDHGLEIEWVDQTADLLQAADFAILGSGTVALEAMLCKTPMVVAYKISKLTWYIVKTFNMMLLPYYSLPNVLHQGFLVPEVMQNELTADRLSRRCEQMRNLTAAEHAALIATFKTLHMSLLPEHPNQAARAVIEVLESPC